MTVKIEIEKWSAEDRQKLGEQLAAILEHADDALPQDPSVLLAIGHAAPNLGDFLDAVGQMLLGAAEAQERAS
jgi:hypothetical protein